METADGSNNECKVFVFLKMNENNKVRQNLRLMFLCALSLTKTNKQVVVNSETNYSSFSHVISNEEIEYLGLINTSCHP